MLCCLYGNNTLIGDLAPQGLVKNSYVNFEADGTKVTYPVEYETFYEDYKQTYTWPRELPDRGRDMTDYDPRCRDFYIQTMDNKPENTFYGPYTSAGNDSEAKFFAGTISKAVVENGDLVGVISLDINLNNQDNLSQIIGIEDQYSYSFISSKDGKPLFYSRFEIQNAETVTFTKLEFSEGEAPLDKEPTSQEAEYFNNTILQEIMNANSTVLLNYTRLGIDTTLAVTPINIMILWENREQTFSDKRGIACIAIDNDRYLDDVNDKGSLWLIIFIIMGVFLFIFFAFIILVWFWFYKIAKYSLRPITVLNKKIKALILTNTEFDMTHANQNITSKEAKELYATCSELLVTRRFAKNDIDK